MNLKEIAIKKVKDKEKVFINNKKLMFKELFYTAFGISLHLETIKLDDKHYFTYDGITFMLDNNTFGEKQFLRVVLIDGLSVNSLKNSTIVLNLDDLGNLLIKKGLDKPKDKNKCKWDEAWVGVCKKECEGDNEFCKKHKGIKCNRCEAQASHTCADTFSLVCGQPLCEEHPSCTTEKLFL